jgi:2-keto-4-pentenoate hydratase/2-oxohepta-3-ene-1,7-dioic acid hydratase in catechol pathway/regulator of RNase E activity RraA
MADAKTTRAEPDLVAAQQAWELLGAKPGKVIAMHIGYAARAAQKGRTPTAPGYFLKPATSLTTGGDVELPAGCEILGFEGEIALVLGRTVRRIGEADAWSAVAAVTAANDLGVFDLRWADKGANVRSKGGDGFTPIGPALLPTGDLDPDAIEIRVWRDDELVQSDSTATLLFSLPRIVSDLSQLMTLEAGDLILTGTPAGASTFTPGQTVEVEVTAAGQSTGRLITGAVQGTTDLPSYSAQPKPTPEQWADASGRPISDFVLRQAQDTEAEQALDTEAGQALDTEPHPELVEGPTLDDHLRVRLGKVAVATLSSLLRKRGLNNVSIDGLRASQPGKRLVGVARTLRYLPNREDLFTSHGGGYNAQKRLFDDLSPGEVVVIDARREAAAGTLGDILALRARQLGAAGIVTDGGVRDAEVITEIGIPTYYAAAHPAVLGRRHVPWAMDETVACGGTTVQPGDIIVGDNDGVLVIPPGIVEELITEAEQQEAEEEFIARMVEAGHPVDGLFPLNTEWRARFESERDPRERAP